MTLWARDRNKTPPRWTPNLEAPSNMQLCCLANIQVCNYLWLKSSLHLSVFGVYKHSTCTWVYTFVLCAHVCKQALYTCESIYVVAIKGKCHRMHHTNRTRRIRERVWLLIVFVGFRWIIEFVKALMNPRNALLDSASSWYHHETLSSWDDSLSLRWRCKTQPRAWP